MKFRLIRKKIQRFLDRQIQHFPNCHTVVSDIQHRFIEPLTLTLRTDDLRIGEKQQIAFHNPHALTPFAAAARSIERESLRAQSGSTGLFGLSKKLADQRVDSGIRRSIGALHPGD